MWRFKLNFHYANFATFTETFPWGKSRTHILKVRDTNHVMICVRDKVRGLCRRLCRQLCRRLSPCIVTD